MKILSISSLKIALAIFVLSMSSSAFSQAQEMINLEKARVTACNDHTEGDICDFTNNTGETINGNCRRSGSADGTLKCVPNN